MMSHEEVKAELSQLIMATCKKDRITKQDLGKIALVAMKYLEDFELTWAIVPARTAFMSYVPPYVVELHCYKKADKKDAAILTLHLRYAIVKVEFEDGDIAFTTITFVGDEE